MKIVNWVPCGHRTPADPPRCTHRSRAGMIVLPAMCGRCPFADAPPVEQFAVLPCVLRGELLREVPCELCGGRDRTIAVHACVEFGECSTSRVAARQTLACCTTCKRRREPPGMAAAAADAAP